MRNLNIEYSDSTRINLHSSHFKITEKIQLFASGLIVDTLTH